MMTWKSVDLPEPVLPAKSACWRVPLPMARYCSFVAPVRPTAIRNSFVVSPVHSWPGAGATCENGTCTRLESMLHLPILCTSSIASSGVAGASSDSVAPSSICCLFSVQSPPDALQADAAFAQFVRHRILTRRRMALVPVHERENSAARAALRDALQPLHRDLAEIHREVGHDEEIIFLRHAAGGFSLYSVIVA